MNSALGATIGFDEALRMDYRIVSRICREGPGTVRPYIVFNAGAAPVPEAKVELNDGINSGLTFGIPNVPAQFWL